MHPSKVHAEQICQGASYFVTRLRSPSVAGCGRRGGAVPRVEKDEHVVVGGAVRDLVQSLDHLRAAPFPLPSASDPVVCCAPSLAAARLLKRENHRQKQRPNTKIDIILLCVISSTCNCICASLLASVTVFMRRF